MCSISHEMFKFASVSGAPPQTLLEELTTLPRPRSRKWLLAFGNRSSAPSTLAIFPTSTTYDPKTRPPPFWGQTTHCIDSKRLLSGIIDPRQALACVIFIRGSQFDPVFFP